jgi:hypothetical protein
MFGVTMSSLQTLHVARHIQIALLKSFMCNVKCLGELLVILNIQMSLRSMIPNIHMSFQTPTLASYTIRLHACIYIIHVYM